MKAIETEYGGYRFRSRLEARWAIFFDACGVEWEYEPEGYVLSDGTAYLPDFLLHDIGDYVDGDLYVEVKGEMNEQDEHKVNVFAKDLSKAGKTFTGAGRSFARLLVVGNLPKGDDDGEMYDNMQCTSYDDWKNNYRLYWIEKAKWFNVWPAIYPAVSLDGVQQRQFQIGDINLYKNSAEKADHEATAKAYSIANKSRFEHGETPERKDILRCAIDGTYQVKEEKAEYKERLRDRCIKDPTICGIHYDDEADARWAVFFEIAGIEYTYHPQGSGKGNAFSYPTFMININSGRDSGKIFVCVKRNLKAQEYNSEKFDYTLVRHDYFESNFGNENAESERIDIRREFCKYYVPPIDILSDTVYQMFDDAFELEAETSKYNEPIMNFETLDGDWYSAILGIGENGMAEFYGVNWCDECKNKIDFHNTERAYSIAKNVKFASNLPDKKWLENNKVNNKVGGIV